MPIQLAQWRQCWFPGLAISNAKIQIYFSNTICRNNNQTAFGNCYGLKFANVDCSFLKKYKFVVLSPIYYNFRHTFVPYGRRLTTVTQQTATLLLLLLVGLRRLRPRSRICRVKCLQGWIQELGLGMSSGVLGGYTRVYGVYQPPGFFDSVYSPH